MRRIRLIAFSLLSFAVALLAVAPPALAHLGNDGRGWYGESTDPVVTSAMFLTIIFFVVVIVVFSLIQWRLEKRKHARMDAAKRRSLNVDWRGGW